MIQHMFLHSKVLQSREHADAPEGRVEDELSLSQSFTAAVVRLIGPLLQPLQQRFGVRVSGTGINGR